MIMQNFEFAFFFFLSLNTFLSIDLYIQLAFVFQDQILNNKPLGDNLGKEVSQMAL